MEVARPPASVMRAEPTEKLDFYESMAHFKNMFPTMEEEVIEAVLRANSGAVDATVDQLLNMSSDCTTTSSELDQIDDSSDSSSDLEGAAASPEPFTINIIPPSPGNSSTSPKTRSPQAPVTGGVPNVSQEIVGGASEVDGQCMSANQPTEKHASHKSRSHHDYVNSFECMPEIPEDVAPPIPEKPACMRNKASPNLMDASITDLVNLGASQVVNASTNNTQMDTLTVDKEDDVFITPTNHGIQEVIPDAPVARDPRQVREKSANTRRPRSMSMPTFQHAHLSPVSLYKKYRPAMLGDLPDDFLRLHVSKTDDTDGRQTTKAKGENRHPRYHKRSTSEQGHMLRHTTSHTRHAHHVRTHSSRGALQQQVPLDSLWLEHAMAENEKRRDALTAAGDLEAVSVLQDEYLALMLQNEEFLRELSQDNDFMSTLQRDRRSASRNASQRTEIKQAKPVSPPEADLEPHAPKPSELQGYAEDRDAHLSTFLDRPAPAASRDECSRGDKGSGDSDTLELRHQLTNMGTTSKSKLMTIARRFFSSRKKKTPSKPLYSQANTPSTMNLLLEEELPAHARFSDQDGGQKVAGNIAIVPSNQHSAPPDVTGNHASTQSDDVTGCGELNNDVNC